MPVMKPMYARVAGNAAEARFESPCYVKTESCLKIMTVFGNKEDSARISRIDSDNGHFV